MVSIKNINFTKASELGQTEAIKKAAEAGLSVGCLTRMAFQRELGNGWLVEIASPLDLQLIFLNMTSGHCADHNTGTIRKNQGKS